LKITVHLRYGKGARSIKESRWKKIKPRAKVTKTGLSDFGYGSIQFFLKR
jgi:hypothetical protein